MKDKLVLFDWGNIVESHKTGYSCHTAWNDLFKACGYEDMNNVYDKLSKYKLNCIRTNEEFEQVYEEIKKEFNFNKTYQEFQKTFNEIFNKIDYYKEVADYEKSLKDRCYVGIFSNLAVFEKDRLDKQVDLDKYDYVFLSFELGMQKPNKDIYEYVSEHVPVKKENILFIDDKLDNVNTAKELGWNAFQLTGLELDKIKEVVDKFLEGEL